jgi:hypothetical protein
LFRLPLRAARGVERWLHQSNASSD